MRELIQGSMRLIRVVGANETPTDEDMSIAQESMSGLLESMETSLLNIYTTTPKIFLLTPGAAQYRLGPAVDQTGAETGANWVTERPVRVERAVLLQSSNIDVSTDPWQLPNNRYVQIAQYWS